MSLFRKVCVTGALMAAMVTGATESLADDKELHIGTLAPRKSPRGKVLQSWNDVFKRTRDALEQGVFDPALVARVEGMGG